MSIDGSNEEVLFWDFSQTITKITLNMGNSEHPAFADSYFEYSLDSGTNWSTAKTNGSGLVTLTLLGGTNQIEFRAAGNDVTDNFYIRSADILTPPSAIPVPAAVWLFGSGLLGLAGLARRKKA